MVSSTVQDTGLGILSSKQVKTQIPSCDTNALKYHFLGC